MSAWELRARSGAQCLDAGELLALDELERGAAARRDKTNLLQHGVARGLDRGDAVTTAHDREASRVRDGLGDAVGARGEGLVLEQAHRAVPEHGFCLGHARSEGFHALRTD